MHSGKDSDPFTFPYPSLLPPPCSKVHMNCLTCPRLPNSFMPFPIPIYFTVINCHHLLDFVFLFSSQLIFRSFNLFHVSFKG